MFFKIENFLQKKVNLIPIILKDMEILGAL